MRRDYRDARATAACHTAALPWQVVTGLARGERDDVEVLENDVRLSICRRGPSEGRVMKPKVVVVMPAYNAGRTLRMTYEELPKDTVSAVILVDDGSTDETLQIARELKLEVFVHDRNYGYGANQKTCYTEALKAGADVVVMVHPDYQYDPRLVPQIIAPLINGEADVVLGSRLKQGT